MLKKKLKQIIPDIILNLYRKIRREVNYKKTRSIMKNLSLSQKFEYIYKNKFWGSGVNKNFYSGEGSHNPKIVKPYVEIIKKILSELPNPIVVDLGCGDFNIGSQLFSSTKKYYGIDVVEDLINFNKKKFENEKLIFSKLDITCDSLPSGNVCLVRQVLQHLSNEDIFSFIKNIRGKFKYLIVTENLPEGNFKPNYNIKSNPDIRQIFNSGVVLHKPDFNLKFKSSKILLKINSNSGNSIVETILYEL